MAMTPRPKSKNLSVRKDGVDALVAQVDELLATRVLVGFASGGPARPGEASNALLGYVHDNGSPARNIPQRQFLLPGVEKARPYIQKFMKSAADLALKGEPEKALIELRKAGQFAVSGVQQKLVDGPFQPLAASTLQARLRAHPNRKGEKIALEAMRAGKPIPPGAVKPLIDTGAMRQAVTFVLRRRGGKS